MKERENIQQELDQHAPLLAEVRKNIAPVPEGYFDTLSDRVLAAASEKQASPLQVVYTKRSQKWPNGLKVAAAVAVLAVAAAGLWPLIGSDAGETVSLADLKQEEAAAYIHSNIRNFELSLMQEADLLDEATVENIDVLPQLEEAPLEDYLEDLEYEDIEALF
jgi:hypothetical protein